MIGLKTICILLVTILIGCNSQEPKFEIKDLYGHWAESADHNVTFTFLKNGIIEYFEDDTKYNYSLKEDQLTISEEDHLIAKYKILLVNSDSLHLETNEGVVKYVKRK